MTQQRAIKNLAQQSSPQPRQSSPTAAPRKEGAAILSFEPDAVREATAAQPVRLADLTGT